MKRKNKKRIIENLNIISFFIISCLTLVLALSCTGKSIKAYSAPIEASFYKKAGTYSPKIITINSDYQNEGSLEVLSADVFDLQNNNFAVKTKEMEEAILAFVPTGLPCDGIISSEYGAREDPISGETKEHKGIDIAVSTGTPIYSTANGIVTEARYSSSYGYLVVVEHSGGYSTIYAHNSKNNVQEGDYICKGDTVAFSGNTGNSTGPHVHYEVRKDGLAINPLPGK